MSTEPKNMTQFFPTDEGLNVEMSRITTLPNEQIYELLRNVSGPVCASTMTIGESPHSLEFYRLLSNAQKSYVNYDGGSAGSTHLLFGMTDHFISELESNSNIDIVDTRRRLYPDFANLAQIDRCHVRMLYVDGTVALSTMDPLSGSFFYDKGREPLYIVEDPEIVQVMLGWFFASRENQGKYPAVGFTTKLGNSFTLGSKNTEGKSIAGIEARNFLRNNVVEGSKVEIVSSWFPDMLTDEGCLREVSKLKDVDLKILVRDPTTNVCFAELPFAVSKSLSYLQGCAAGFKQNIIPIAFDLHGKLILITNPDGSVYSFVTSSNLTSFGDTAEEYTLITSSTTVQNTLREYLDNLYTK